jgi:hypothetical protein
MTASTPSTRAVVARGSRLEGLLAVYANLKPQADELASRLKGVTDAIKAELTSAYPLVGVIDVEHPLLAQPLRLSYVESWRVDTKQPKADAPEVYVRYAVKSGTWQLRGGKA